MTVVYILLILFAIAVIIVVEFFAKKKGNEQTFRTGGLFLLFLLVLIAYTGCIQSDSETGESDNPEPSEMPSRQL